MSEEGFPDPDPELGPSEQAVLYMILFLVGASGVHIRCYLDPVEAGFLLFGFVWWLDCLLLKEGPISLLQR